MTRSFSVSACAVEGSRTLFNRVQYTPLTFAREWFLASGGRVNTLHVEKTYSTRARTGNGAGATPIRVRNRADRMMA
jgi:hypothetical protein